MTPSLPFALADEGQWLVHNNVCEIPQPGETSGYSDRFTGEPPQDKVGIYEFKGTDGKWYVGEAGGRGDNTLLKRLQSHIRSGKLGNMDDVVWTEIPKSSKSIFVAEQARIEQVVKMVGAENVSNNLKHPPINPPGARSLYETYKNLEGWPDWLYFSEG